MISLVKGGLGMEDASSRTEIKQKLRENFDGKIVAKDLTKKSKKGLMFLYMFLSFCLGRIVVVMMKKLLKRV